MKRKTPSSKNTPATLRQRKPAPEESSRADAQKLIHELQVHQVELEMQNEELRRAQAELETSRDQFSALYDFAPVGYLTLDEQGVILQANLTVAAMLGVERARLIKKPLTRHIHKQDQDIFYLHRNALVETRAPQTCELRLVKADGTSFPVRMEGNVAQDENGAPICRVTLDDINKRKRDEVRLNIQHTVTLALSEADTLAEAMPKILQAVCEGLDWKRGECWSAIWSMDKETMRLHCVESCQIAQGESPQFETVTSEIQFEPGEGMPGRVFASGKPEWTPDIAKDGFARVAQALKAGYRAAFAFPVKVGSETLGVMTFLDGKVRPPDEGQLQVMESVGHQIGQFVERKRAENAVRQRNEDLALINALNDAANRGEDIESITAEFAREARAAFNCRDAAVYLLTPDEQQIVMYSYTLPPALREGIEKLIGNPIPKIQIRLVEGSYFRKILDSESGVVTNDPRTFQKWMAEFAETTFLPNALRGVVRKLIPQIFKILNIDSTISIPLVSSGRAIGILDISSGRRFTEEDLRRLQPIARQMTAILLRKRAEQALKESESRFRSLVEHSSDEISIVDAEARLLYESPSANPTLGYPPGEFLRQSLFELVHPDDRERVQNKLAQAIADPAAHPRDEFRLKRRDGSWVWVEAVGTNLLADPAVRGVVINYHDITARKEAEETLALSEARLRAAVENLPFEFWVCDKDGRCTLQNPVAAKNWGEVVGLLPEEMNVPEDIRNFWMENNQRALSGQSINETGEIYRNGERKNFINILTPIRKGSSVEGFVGINIDITERKRAEEEIKTQLDELQRWHNVTLGRETRALELKREVNALLRHLGEPIRYPSAEEE